MKTVSLISLLAGLIIVGNCASSDVKDRTDKQLSNRNNPSSANQFGANGGWQDLVTDLAGGIFLGAENGVIFYAYDVLTYPNEPVELVVRVQMAKFLENVPGVTVGFHKGSELIGTFWVAVLASASSTVTRANICCWIGG